MGDLGREPTQDQRVRGERKRSQRVKEKRQGEEAKGSALKTRECSTSILGCLTHVPLGRLCRERTHIPPTENTQRIPNNLCLHEKVHM